MFAHYYKTGKMRITGPGPVALSIYLISTIVSIDISRSVATVFSSHFFIAYSPSLDESITIVGAGQRESATKMNSAVASLPRRPATAVGVMRSGRRESVPFSS